jgi:hypothetical protein
LLKLTFQPDQFIFLVGNILLLVIKLECVLYLTAFSFDLFQFGMVAKERSSVVSGEIGTILFVVLLLPPLQLLFLL